ncbi:1-deoxy-D-xylulose-5-phosphate synthase [Amycolatopsis nigrescens]|uniref:1-deoxy-D-xylulose-5-phosphate synthase n=1 Tax=Amycolatopsis nigrescens TaxID=381445 RepID=UPI0003638FA8|nr:1-deoxy-D-xylulose-5-phosphate synthase [Amycolatopsis nigrescens]
MTTQAEPSTAIPGPAGLRELSAGQLLDLAGRIREFLIDRVCRSGGHLGPNLGVVELTLALHRVFDSPRDVLLFDTGHQSYVHKMITGRAGEFGSLRQSGGLSGYPSQAESVHDVIENSHASTALSYADGLAKAFAHRGELDRRVVALVGDGALTGGMCWEALNNLAGAPHRPVIIVLNDNGRSYAPTVGGLSGHLARLRGPARANLFETLGLRYLGPVDGHDVAAVEDALRCAVALDRPVVVHCVTSKGKGYPPAEQDEADCLHAVGVVDPVTGRPGKPSAVGWTSVFGARLAEIAEVRPDVVAVTAAMLGPTGLGRFAERFPDRVYDVGIAEQHAITSAAGLALGGLHPVVAIYSTFLNRAFDQLLMDVALHRLPVTVVADRAGITGQDGPSHHGVWDASVLPVVPGLRLAAPRDGARLRELLTEAVDVRDGPTVLRYPKGALGPDLPAVRRIGGCDLLRVAADVPAAADVLLVAVGPMAEPCLAAAAELAALGPKVTVVDPRWVAPLDPALLELAGAHRKVLVVEDAVATGSLGARLAQALPERTVATRALRPGFLPHAARGELLRAHGLDAEGIRNAVLDLITGLNPEEC